METMHFYGFAAIAVVCLVILFLGNSKKKSNAAVSFIQRGIVGFLLILGLNKLFAALSLSCFVGLNLWTLLTSAILGIPGVCMLYCISLL